MPLTDRVAHQKLTGTERPADPGHHGFKAFLARAVVGFQKLGEQEPYFHVLAGLDRKLRNNRWESSYPRSGGPWCLCADHQTFLEHFAPFKVLVRYHLWSLRSGPMHYKSNALYHARMARAAKARGDLGEQSRATKAFEEAVGLGLLMHDTDTINVHERIQQSDEVLDTWLDIRLPRLMHRFENDVKHLLPGIWEQAETL